MNKEIRRFSNYSSLPVLIFVMFMQLSSAAVQIGLLTLERMLHTGIPQELKYLVIYFFIYPVGGGLAALIFYKTRKRETGLRLSGTFCKPQMSAGRIIRWMVITWGAALIASLITNIATSVIENLLHFESNKPSFDFGDGAGGFLVGFIALCLFAPFFEEVIFRSAVYRHTEIMGQGFAIIFSAAMFALMHGNLDQLLYTFVMGLGLAYIFAKTRSLPITILLHFLTNFTSVFFTNIIGSTGSDTDKLLSEFSRGNLAVIIPSALYSLIIYGLMIAGIVLGIIELVHAIKRGQRLMGSIFPISGVKKAVVFLTAPITLITIIIMVALLIVTTFALIK